MEIASLVMSVDARPVKKASEELSKFTKQAAATEQATGRFSKSMRDAGSSGSALNKVLGITAGLLSARQILQAAESWVTLNNRLRLVTDSTNAFNIAQENIFRIAQETRQGLTATAELYQRIATNQKELGITGQETADIVKTINQALVISGTSGAGAEAALVQLGQAFASGTLRGEELNAVLEQAPALAQAIARGMGVTVGQLRALGAEGVLTADSVVKALQSQADAVEKQFLTMTPTVSGALKTLDNSFIQLIGSMDESAGASANASGAISELAYILSDPKIIEVAKYMASTLGAAFGAITTMLMNAIEESGGMGNAVSNAVDKSVRALAFIIDAADAVTRVFGVIGRAGVVAFLALKSGAMDVAASIIEGPLDALNYLIRGFNELGQYIGTTFREIEPPKFAQGLRQEAADAAAAARIGMDDIQSILMEPLAGRTFIDLYEQAQQVGASLEVAGAAANNATVPFKRLGEEAGSASKEVVKLNKAVADGDHDAAAKAIEDYRREVEQLEDRLDPVGKATKQYQKDVALLASAHARGEISGEKYATMLATLEGEYAKATEVSGEWAQWTESALERVDGAFADAWKNIGDGFSGFRDSLTNAFKQMLAELAHMAITRPIVMQIGAALGIGGMQSGGQGLLGSLLGGGGGSGGGFSIGNLLQYGQQAYSLFTGVGPAALAGYQSGGIMGGIQGAGSYYGNIASNAWNTASGWFGGGGAAAGGSVSGGAGVMLDGAGNVVNYGAQSGGGGLSGIGGQIGQYAGPIALAIAAINAYKALQGGYEVDASRIDPEGRGGLGGYFQEMNFQLLKGVEKLDNVLEKVFGGGFLGRTMRLGTTIIGQVMETVFGGGWQTKDSGLAFSVTGGDLVSEQFEYQKKKGGLLGKNKKRTTFSALDEEAAAQFEEAFIATEQTVSSLFEELSYTVTEASLDGLNLDRSLISTQGKTQEEIQKEISAWFVSLGDSMTAELNKVFGTGLDLDLAGLQAFVVNLKGVNEVLRYLDVDMYEASVAGGKLADSLSAVSGGLEALAQNSQTYYDAFFTQAEKTEDTIDAIKRAFAAADVELVSSREAYRAAVEAIDLTSESGQEMFATMMALSGQAAAYFDILEAKAEQAKQAELQAQQVALQAQQALINGLLSAIRGAVDTAYSALQRAVAEQQAQISESIGRVNANISDLTAIGSALDSAFKQLRGNSEAATRSIRAHAVMTLNSALVSARAGNSLAGFAGLQDALDVASQMDTELYASLVDFEREQGRTANLIDELQGINSKQLSAEQQMLRALQDQQNKLNEELKTAQDQLDALNGIDGSVKSVADAVKAMNDAVVAALSTVADGMAMLNTGKNNSTLIDTLYKTILGRDADAAGKAYWENQLQSGALDYDQIAVAIGNAATQNKNESMTGQSSANDYLIKTVQSAYKTILGRSADQAGVDYWVSQLISGAIAGDQLYQALANGALASAGESEEAKKSAGQWLGLPGFANGGAFGGGLRIVGDNGPEIEATGPSRIFNAGQTADMLSGGSQADEVAAMRAEMTDALRAIAKHTQQTARRVEYLERWDFDGLPEQRAAV